MAWLYSHRGSQGMNLTYKVLITTNIYDYDWRSADESVSQAPTLACVPRCPVSSLAPRHLSGMYNFHGHSGKLDSVTRVEATMTIVHRLSYFRCQCSWNITSQTMRGSHAVYTRWVVLPAKSSCTIPLPSTLSHKQDLVMCCNSRWPSQWTVEGSVVFTVNVCHWKDNKWTLSSKVQMYSPTV